MSKVHILPPDVISKIAAGEVIERPASVIKELMENALDAKPQSIEVELEQAGKTSITIRDTGTGIEQDDIKTIFLRHSTSKIESADDLFNIHSLGFRGEALYSIAAISDVVLRSKTKEQDSGWEIHVRGGEQLDLKPVSMHVGTEIEIKELFFNTPARRKFLKTNTTEINQVIETFIPYTLLYPQIRFVLTHQNKKVLELDATESLTSRIMQALNFAGDPLIEVEQEYPEENIKLRLVLGDINIARTRRDLQFIFINGRPVQNKSVSYHLNDVYRLLMPPGNFPFFAVFITMSPELLDVNIHPAKREVKIKNEQTVTSLLRHLTEAALMKAGGPKQAAGDMNEPSLEIGQALRNVNRIEKIFDGALPADIFQPLPDPDELAPTKQYSFPKAEPLSMVGESLFQQKQDTLQSKLERSRYIGSLLNKFLLFEADRSLLVIDQHAAQERITFEHLVKQMQNGTVEVQRLLSPYQIRLTIQEMNFWEESKEKLNTIGFETTQFDDETIAVHSYPVLIGEPDRAVRELLAGGGIARTDHETIARRACKASIRAGDSLHSRQAEFQREQLLTCRDPFTCPHGRPTVIEMAEGFLDKQFLRT